MLRILIVNLLVVCSLPGCVGINPVALTSARHLRVLTSDQHPGRDFDMHKSREAIKAIEAIDHQMMRESMQETPRGSQVQIVDELDRRYLGTLIRVSPDEVELMNCICREVVAGPDGHEQCKTSHVPFQSLPTESMTHFLVVSPPSSDFAPPDAGFDRGDVSVEEIVYRSGRHQRWAQSP
ncbi:MAG: hypothetical protein WCJ09_19045 [Planctomycetota bacterium]